MKWPEDYINKVICGDCLEVMQGIPNGVIDAVITDPPYGMGYQSNRRINRLDRIENDHKVNDFTWFDGFCEQSMRVMATDSMLYSFCNEYAMADFRMLMSQHGFSIKRLMVWVKNIHGTGDLEGDYGNMTEFILFGTKGRPKLNGKRSTNVLNFDRVGDLRHPTEKPVDLLGFLITKSSDPDGIILDPFAGSGSTCKAAKQLGRRYIGIEISPEYCKIAEDRLRQEELF